MDLRRLRYLVAVADEGHITRAAERLGIQQPPLTRQIQLLEQELGAQLLHRHPRGVSLTEAGAAVVAEARGLLVAAERIGETARRAARGEQGRMAVGYTSSAAFHPFVFRQVNGFRRAWPGVQLVLEEESTVELMRALIEERLDAAFIRTLGGNPAGLLVEPLVDEAMLAALPPEHRFSRREVCDLSELAEETFVFYRRPAGQGLYDAIIAACHVAGFSPQIAQEAPRLPATLSLVAAGLGISIVPASMRRMSMEGVTFLRLTGAPGLTAPLMLATRRTRRAAVVDRFRQAVLAGVGEA
jgi:DNA-binding transcriptional LysR family regulator